MSKWFTQKLCNFQFCTRVQFANSDICTQTWSCHSGGCFDPENAKISTACWSLVMLLCPPNFNFDPPPPTRQLLNLKKVITLTFLTLSLCWGCLTITAAFSSCVDAYVCRMWTNPATCACSTVSHSTLPKRSKLLSPSLESRMKMGVKDTGSRHSRWGRWFERSVFGRCSALLWIWV